MQARFGLNEKSLVVEVASNDGYLLQYFVKRNVPVLGIEPAANVAKVAVEKGVPTLVRILRNAGWRRNWLRKADPPTWFSATTFWRRFPISMISSKGSRFC